MALEMTCCLHSHFVLLMPSYEWTWLSQNQFLDNRIKHLSCLKYLCSSLSQFHSSWKLMKGLGSEGFVLQWGHWFCEESISPVLSLLGVGWQGKGQRITDKIYVVRYSRIAMRNICINKAYIIKWLFHLCENRCVGIHLCFSRVSTYECNGWIM